MSSPYVLPYRLTGRTRLFGSRNAGSNPAKAISRCDEIGKHTRASRLIIYMKSSFNLIV